MLNIFTKNELKGAVEFIMRTILRKHSLDIVRGFVWRYILS